MDKRIIAAASLGMALALTSCSLLGGPPLQDPEEVGQSESADPEDYGDFPYEKEGRMFVEGGDDIGVRVSIEAIESTAEYTMLEYGLTTLDPLVGEATQLSSPSRLVDPIDGLAYEQLVDPADPDGRPFGSYFEEDDGVGVMPIHEGAPRMTRAFFPPLPEYVTHVTFTGQSMGAMTGIPVSHVDQVTPMEEPNAHDLIDSADWEPYEPIPEGTEVWYPVREPQGDFWDAPKQMESMVDDGEVAVTRAGTQETFALNADVAFDFDESDLKDEMEGTLTDLAEYMADHLDAEGHIQVTGHTDSVGDDAYNQTLSEERAESVHELLEPHLGDAFEIRTEGRGSTEPLIADDGDDEDAQARNRRVDIAHELPLDVVTEQEQARHDGIEERAGAPGAFDADDGEVQATLSDGDVELNVYPFVRDGSYVVGVMGFQNTGSEPVVPDLGGESARLPGQPDQFTEGTLGGFQIVDELGTTRSVVQINDIEEGYSSFAEEVHELHPGEEYRTIAWFLAPDDEVTELTLEAGALGEAEDIPIH